MGLGWGATPLIQSASPRTRQFKQCSTHYTIRASILQVCLVYSPHSGLCAMTNSLLHTLFSPRFHTAYYATHLVSHLPSSSPHSHVLVSTLIFYVKLDSMYCFVLFTTALCSHVVILYSPLYVIVSSLHLTLCLPCPWHSLLLCSTQCSLCMLHSTQHLSYPVCYSLSSPLHSALSFLPHVSDFALHRPFSVLHTLLTMLLIHSPGFSLRLSPHA